MGLFSRNRTLAEVPYVPLARPRLNQDRLLDPTWMGQAGKKAVAQTMRLGSRAHDVFARNEDMQYFAPREVTPLVDLLQSKLKKARPSISVAATDQLLAASCVGWTVAAIERAETGWHREGYTHPIVHNGLAVYYTSNLAGNEATSLRLAVETAYYAVRTGLGRRDAEPPQQILSELLSKQ